MFERKKQGLVKRFVKRIREYYMYCKCFIAEKVAVKVGQQCIARAEADTTPGINGYWCRFKTRMESRKFFTQAAICRYARRSGTYKNL